VLQALEDLERPRGLQACGADAKVHVEHGTLAVELRHAAGHEGPARHPQRPVFRLHCGLKESERMKEYKQGLDSSSIQAGLMNDMWNILTLIFVSQWAMVLAYCAALACFPDFWWTCTLMFGVPFAYICIQNIYIDHDVMHGATFPPYDWQEYITHCWSDFFSLPWKEFVLEHNRHHASTVDLLQQGEFGWDPEEFQYWLLEWTWRHKKYPFPIHPFGLVLTGALLPFVHFFGLNDTGALFALEWYFHFPEKGAGGIPMVMLYRSVLAACDPAVLFVENSGLRWQRYETNASSTVSWRLAARRGGLRRRPPPSRRNRSLSARHPLRASRRTRRTLPAEVSSA